MVTTHALRLLRRTLFAVVLCTTTFTTGCDVAMISGIFGGLLTAFSTQVDDPTLGTAMRAVGAGLGFAAGDGNVQAEEVLQASAAAFANETLAGQGVPVQIGPNGQVYPGQMPGQMPGGVYGPPNPGQNPNGGVFGPPVAVPSGQDEYYRRFRQSTIENYNNLVRQQGLQQQTVDQAVSMGQAQFPQATPQMVAAVRQELLDFVNQQIQQQQSGPSPVPAPIPKPQPQPQPIPPVIVDQGPIFNPGGGVFNPGPQPGPVVMAPPQNGGGGGGINVGFQIPIGSAQIGGNVSIPFNF